MERYNTAIGKTPRCGKTQHPTSPTLKVADSGSPTRPTLPPNRANADPASLYSAVPTADAPSSADRGPYALHERGARASSSGGDGSSTRGSSSPDTDTMGIDSDAKQKQARALTANAIHGHGGHGAGMVVLGYDISRWPSNQQFALLAGGHLVAALTFALLQEKVFLVPGFKFPGFMTLLTSMTYAALAFAERWLTNDAARKGKVVEYFILAVSTFGGMYFTNWSLSYINYPTRIMFKSGKVIPVMCVGMVFGMRRYGTKDFLNAAVLVAGITIFVLGDAKVSPSFNVIGLFLITVGVLMDAFTSNYEESKFFRDKNCSHLEVMGYSSVVAACYALAGQLFGGQLWPALAHARAHPEVLQWTLGFSVMGYLQVGFILLLIKHFNATNAEIIKSSRKVLSIALSFLLIGKPMSVMHLVGCLFFVAFVAGSFYLKQQRKRLAKQAGSALPGPSKGGAGGGGAEGEGVELLGKR